MLVDFNPWGVVTDSLLYTWKDLDILATQSFDIGTEQVCME